MSILSIKYTIGPLIYEIQRDRLRYLKDIEERIRWYFDELNFIKI